MWEMCGRGAIAVVSVVRISIGREPWRTFAGDAAGLHCDAL